MVRVCTVMDYPTKKFWEYRDEVIAAFLPRPALWFWEIR